VFADVPDYVVLVAMLLNATSRLNDRGVVCLTYAIPPKIPQQLVSKSVGHPVVVVCCLLSFS
jgi:hypothetical protein